MRIEMHYLDIVTLSPPSPAHRHQPSESVLSPALSISTLLTIDVQSIFERCVSMQKPTALDRTVKLVAPTDSLQVSPLTPVAPVTPVSGCAFCLTKASRGTHASTQELLETRRSALVVLRW